MGKDVVIDLRLLMGDLMLLSSEEMLLVRLEMKGLEITASSNLNFS
jgi:hypothetical protein